MMHPEDAAWAKALITRHFRGKLAYYDCQIRVRHKHGHWVWIHDRGYLESRTADGQPLLMYGTHTDISETKHQEEQVRNARAFLQAVLDAATGVSIIATETSGPGWLQVLPCGATPGTTSNVNFDRAGAIVNGLATVPFDNNGTACVYIQASTHVVVDLQGYFDTAAFDDVADQRLLDTRL